MFLIRAAIIGGVVVLLLPADPQQQAQLVNSAGVTVERALTFCDRNAHMCEQARNFGATIVKKAEFGVTLAAKLINQRGSTGSGDQLAASTDEPMASPAAHPVSPPAPAATAKPVQAVQPNPTPQHSAAPAGARGTLKSQDLTPPWRGEQKPAPRARVAGQPAG